MTAPSLHATSNRLFQAVPLCHTTGGARTGEAPAIRHTWRPVAVRPDRARSSPHTWPQCDARSEAVPSPADGGTRRFRGHGLHSPPPEATWHAGFVNQGLQWAMGADRSGTPAVETISTRGAISQWRGKALVPNWGAVPQSSLVTGWDPPPQSVPDDRRGRTNPCQQLFESSTGCARRGVSSRRKRDGRGR
jgi:hypothetical protein